MSSAAIIPTTIDQFHQLLSRKTQLHQSCQASLQTMKPSDFLDKNYKKPSAPHELATFVYKVYDTRSHFDIMFVSEV